MTIDAKPSHIFYHFVRLRDYRLVYVAQLYHGAVGGGSVQVFTTTKVEDLAIKSWNECK